jgi:hypothetical protein
VARSWLQFEAARCRGHADVAFPRGVMLSHGPCPPSCRRPRGGAGRAEVVDVGRHRVVREVGLSTGVHHGVPLHEFPLGQRLVPVILEGEVGKLVGGEPKMLLCWVGPQHADDDLVREASDDSLASRSPRYDITTRGPGEGVPGDGLCRPGVDEAEGAEAQSGPRSQRDPAVIHQIR